MGDSRTILNHYNISEPFPTEWPTEKDASDDSDTEPKPKPRSAPRTKPNMAKSRYSVLERHVSERRSLVPGSEKTRDGVETLVLKDEPDALGSTDSVVRTLRRKGLPVEDDERFRNRFLLSSTTFTPALYLSQVHADASTQSLLQGLEFLSRSIDQKSASLKVLVESNFERFVRAKSTIDDVYTEMRNQGADPEPTHGRHSRHTSRSSLHYRNLSGQGAPGKAGFKPPINEKRKHALIKESEYGVQGIKAPLVEVAVKAEEVWGPALGGRERENNLKSTLESVEKHQDVFEIGKNIAEAIKTKDYDTLVTEYSKARRLTDETKSISEAAIANRQQLSDPQVHQIVLTARMWIDVEVQIENFKRGIWRDLTSVQANLTMSTDRSHQDDHVALINVLMELGVEDNPVWVWLLSRYDYLKNKINSTFERSRVEIEVFRRRLANAEKPSLYASAAHFKAPTRSNAEEIAKQLDTGPILELWELIIHAMGNLLSLQGGVLGEVMDFWDKAQSFIDGRAQRSLPVGYDGQSRKHHRLSVDGVKDLQNGAKELVDILREHVFAFFADPPIEDVSLLFSPAGTDTPNTPKTPFSATLSPFSKPDQRFNLDLLSPPPPSPKRGEAWEEFAFWPPYANSLSGVHYLGKLLVLLATAAGEMAALKPVASGGTEPEKLKILLNATRERCARAICAAWNVDAQSCKVLEEWTRGPESRDVTRMPSYFAALEAFILSGTQKILYIPEAAVTKRGSADIITPPPNKLLQMVRSQFVSSLYKALSGMVENAERPVNMSQNPWAMDRDSVLVTKGALTTADTSRDVVDASSRNLRMLLTLSNLKALRTEVVPQLLNQFETDFSVKLTEETKTIYDVLSQIDTRLFQSYTRPISEKLVRLISEGIASPSWIPITPRPTEVRPYVYHALLQLVYVHTEVSTTASQLTLQILSHLFEQIIKALLDALRARPKYTLPALMQATLDVEFFAQTLNQYGTEKASEIQSQIYVDLDKNSDNSARTGLQHELPEMRHILKKLRESTRTEFACFRKAHSSRRKDLELAQAASV